jgi:type I restriction enzyme M protein
MARMNLAIRGIEANLGAEHADTFHRDLHPDLRADFVMANPPFNDQRLGRRAPARRRALEVRHAARRQRQLRLGAAHRPPPGAHGTAGFVLANGSMSSKQSGEGEIRRKLVEADLVDCMVAMPGQLFYATQIPVCLWFLARDKSGNGSFRDRRKGEVLFIDARKLGRMIDRTQRELTDDDIAKIAGTYHAWRGDKGAATYADVAGFCKTSVGT